MFQTCNLRILFKELQQFFFNIIQRIVQNRAGVNTYVIMYKEARNTQRANHSAGRGIEMFVVIINIPVYAAVNFHINAGVI